MSPNLLVQHSGNRNHHPTANNAQAREFARRAPGVYITDANPDHDSAFGTSVDAKITHGSGGGVAIMRGAGSDEYAQYRHSTDLFAKVKERRAPASAEGGKPREKITEISTIHLK